MSFMFLPEDYEAPKSGGYWMKIQQGENKIRILSQPILGWEEWTKEMKPVRYTFDNKPEKAINPKQPPRHFWSFIVWNYNEEQIQILHITQAGIRKGIEALCKDSDWGAPFFYDIKIFKEGEDIKTKYMVNPLPHKPVSVQIIESFNERPCNLDAIFDNMDPFARDWKRYTQGIFSNDQMLVKDEEKATLTNELITDVQAKELQDILSNCDSKYVKTVWDTLGKAPLNVKSLNQLPAKMYERLKQAAIKKATEYQAEEVDWIMEA